MQVWSDASQLTLSDDDTAVGGLSSIAVETFTRVDARVVDRHLVNFQSKQA